MLVHCSAVCVIFPSHSPPLLPSLFVFPPSGLFLNPAENPNSFMEGAAQNKYNLGEEPPSPPRQGTLMLPHLCTLRTQLSTSTAFPAVFTEVWALQLPHVPSRSQIPQAEAALRANIQQWPSSVLFGDYSLSSQNFPLDFCISFRYKPPLNVGILRPHQVYFMVLSPLPLHINIHIHMFLYKHTHVWISLW